jgi:uncharacterized damage-inducible protein DinB
VQFNLDQSIPILSRTPAVLRALLADLSPEWTERPYGENTWSAKEVVGHLLHGERTDWIARMNIILEQGESRPFDRFDRAGHKPMMQTHSLSHLLDLFEAERKKNLDILRSKNLTSADLTKRGTHPALGTVTLANLLATWAVHDLNHIAQICKAMAYQYKGEVGPWEQYLSILSPPNPR